MITNDSRSNALLEQNNESSESERKTAPLHSRFDHVLKRASDPGHIETNVDKTPLQPFRRWSGKSEAARDLFEIRASFIKQLSEELAHQQSDDEGSTYSFISDITNPSAFHFQETMIAESLSDSTSPRQEPPSKDTPLRPYTRVLSASSDVSLDLDDELPPPPLGIPSPRPFGDQPSGTRPSLEVGVYKDKPPRPFERAVSEGTVTTRTPSLSERSSFLSNSQDSTNQPPRTPMRDASLSFSLGSSTTRAAQTALEKLGNLFARGMSVGTHTHRLKKYDNSFVGKDAVDFMIRTNLACTREDAVFLGQRVLQELNLFHHVTWDHNFKDGFYFYRFTDDSTASLPSHFLTSLEVTKMAFTFLEIIRVADHSHHFIKYKDTFVGSEAVDQMIIAGMATDRKHAVFLGQRLLDEVNLFHHVSHEHQFKDALLFYRFTKCEHFSSDSTVASEANTSSSDDSTSASGSRVSMTLFLSTLHNTYQNRNSLHSVDLTPTVPKASRKKEGRSVSFGTVQARYFDRTLDVNPATSTGPSIGLGWLYEDHQPVSIPSEVVKKVGSRSPKDFCLSSNQRKEMLHKWGHNKVEIYLATKLNERIRLQRKKTLNNLTVKAKEEEKLLCGACNSIDPGLQ